MVFASELDIEQHLLQLRMSFGFRTRCFCARASVRQLLRCFWSFRRLGCFIAVARAGGSRP